MGHAKPIFMGIPDARSRCTLLTIVTGDEMAPAGSAARNPALERRMSEDIPTATASSIVSTVPFPS